LTRATTFSAVPRYADDAGLAVDAGAFDDVVAELVAWHFFLARREAIG
jgi:hypothetical protein